MPAIPKILRTHITGRLRSTTMKEDFLKCSVFSVTFSKVFKPFFIVNFNDPIKTKYFYCLHLIFTYSINFPVLQICLLYV